MDDISNSINKWGDDFIGRITQAMDFSPLFPQIREIVLNSVSRNFSEEGRFGTGDFDGGSEHWKKSKRAIKQGGQTLSEKSALRKSIQCDIHQEGGKLKIVIGSNLEYAAAHQFGAEITINPREGSAKWKAKKNKATGKYSYRFAKKTSNTKNTIERKFQTKGHVLKLPARPYLVLQDEDIREIIELCQEHIIEQLNY